MPSCEIYRRFTKRDAPPAERVREAWFVIGRRGGKSRAIAVLTVYLACLCKHERLVKGETGVALVIAPDKKQARVILEYANGIIEDSALLRQTLVKRSAEELQLKGRIKIEVRSSSFRRIRGLTAIAVLADECAFWLSEDSCQPGHRDTERCAACVGDHWWATGLHHLPTCADGSPMGHVRSVTLALTAIRPSLWLTALAGTSTRTLTSRL